MIAQTTADRLLYSTASSARILGVKPASISHLVEGRESISVHFKKGTPTTIAKSAYAAEFIRFRRDAGRQLSAVEYLSHSKGTVYLVAGRQDIYQVEATHEHISCTCEDWHQHTTVCKHGWAVLHQLGHNSLETYLDRVNSIAA